MNKKNWFILLDDIYTQTAESLLPCETYCPDCYCEKREKVYLLPYEADFLLEKRNINIFKTNAFWNIRIRDGEDKISIMVKGKYTPCPFLKNNKCTIHYSRPMDCRSFPFMPVFQKNSDNVRLVLEDYCPLVKKKNQNLFENKLLYKQIWKRLSQQLPKAWKLLYWKSGKILPEISATNSDPKVIDL